jgi:hypothetical protein
MTKTERIEKYLADFFSTRMQDWRDLKDVIYRNRGDEIYHLPEGNHL